ncbi:MAG TPA: GPO family capsid scaffolding protein [Herbaspirillum sp.]|nr:GPO family capsid scaffolding protein [Herbaspirillum sp.]
MATKSKFFRVATEGATTDGRTITRTWIQQMATNFNTQKYGARVWLEHLRGIMPDGPFRAYGDVSAVKAEEVEIDGEKRLALYAEIAPTPDLVAMNQAKQKIYTSIEVDPDFANSGEAYLVGLAVTDSPASLGTEVLQFSAKNPEASPFQSRKMRPENLFSAAVETEIEFVEVKDQKTFIQKMKDIVAKLNRKDDEDAERFAQIAESMQQLVEHIDGLDDRFASKQAMEKLQKDHQNLLEKFLKLMEQLENESDPQPKRPFATGTQSQQTDC